VGSPVLADPIEIVEGRHAGALGADIARELPERLLLVVRQQRADLIDVEAVFSDYLMCVVECLRVFSFLFFSFKKIFFL
jgi:hypothetical protein